MPSDRRQLSVRMDDDTAARFDRLMQSMPGVIGVEITQAQLVALALRSLEEKHPAGKKKGEKS